MNGRALALAAALTLCGTAGWVQAAPAPSASALLASIARNGAKASVRQLTRRNQFEAVLTRIESGDPAWLKVAQRLRGGVDAGDSEALLIAVARALPKAPERVLASGFSLDSICTSPFIEPEPGVAERYERQALAALRKVKAPGLKVAAARCARKVKLPPA
ncbi:MAG: hypothetical protein ABIO39_05825 [Caulobacteraceae bacterium]